MHRAPPTSWPSFDVLIDDAGGVFACSRYLGVSQRTLTRWRAAGQAPRAHTMALWWLTRWSVSQSEADAFNAAQQSAMLAASYRREAERLAGVVARLETDHDWGSANSPIFNAR